jgi:hypothetical protein
MGATLGILALLLFWGILALFAGPIDEKQDNYLSSKDGNDHRER